MALSGNGILDSCTRLGGITVALLFHISSQMESKEKLKPTCRGQDKSLTRNYRCRSGEKIIVILAIGWFL